MCPAKPLSAQRVRLRDLCVLVGNCQSTRIYSAGINVSHKAAKCTKNKTS